MCHDLEKSLESPRSDSLVFTSAGDRSSLHHWMDGERDFDLWVSYYGEQPGRYRDQSDYYLARKGGKFPGLHFVYQKWPHLLERYRAVLVLDDDVLIRGTSIRRLFEIRDEFDLWLLQAAFHPLGKVSHPITVVDPGNRLRFTSFVENTCPLFRRDKLDLFMKVYDPVLVGWGTDWWFLDVLSRESPQEAERRIAIVDEVSCFNPPFFLKGFQREIDTLQPARERKEKWEAIRARHGIESEERGAVEFGRIPRAPGIPGLLRTASLLPFLWARGLARWVWRRLRRR